MIMSRERINRSEIRFVNNNENSAISMQNNNLPYEIIMENSSNNNSHNNINDKEDVNVNDIVKNVFIITMKSKEENSKLMNSFSYYGFEAQLVKAVQPIGNIYYYYYNCYYYNYNY